MQKRAARFVMRNHSRETSIAYIYSPEVDLQKFMPKYIKWKVLINIRLRIFPTTYGSLTIIDLYFVIFCFVHA